VAVRSAPSHPPTSAVGGKVPAKSARPMRGLVEEAQHEISQQDTKRPIMDLVIVAGMRRIEHHEIAAYGTDIALAKAFGEREVVDLLTLTLEEESKRTASLPKCLSSTSCRRLWHPARRRRRAFGPKGKRRPPKGRLSKRGAFIYLDEGGFP
jgi:Domain of unknown function (DUF892)